MLCQFSFKNFKSYKDETIFDFQAHPLQEFEDTLLRTEKASDLLPVSVIYGPNGGGKTMFLQALSCLIDIVVSPIRRLEMNRIKGIIQHSVECKPFMLDDSSRSEPTEFLIYFRTHKNEFRYYLSVLNGEIVSESLSRKMIGGKRTAHIFDREGKTISIGPSIKKASISVSVNPKMPYLSFLAINYNIPIIVEVQKWFESCIVRNYGNPLTEEFFEINNHDIIELVVQLLNDMGIDIDDYRFDEEKKLIFTKRMLHGKEYELSIFEESAGTQKLLQILPVIMLGIAAGSLTIIDELDAKLHPKLLRYVISMFKDQQLNRKGAQLLFTSHDMSTMKKDVFRRDEIWFAALKEDHSSELYSLYDLRDEAGNHVSPNAAFDRQYLAGRYGADPYLQKMMGGDWM